MKILILIIIFSTLLKAEELKKGSENIVSYTDVYRTKPSPEFKAYIVDFYIKLETNPKRNNPDYIRYKTVPVFFEQALIDSVELPKNLTLNHICYFFKTEKMNVWGVNKKYWDSLLSEEKKLFFYENYDNCSFKNTKY